MRMMTLVSHINHPASPDKPSEDAIGFDVARNMAWAIDGASDDYLDMLRHKDTHERLDAFWAANTLSALFQHHAQTATDNPRQYFRDILTRFTALFENASGQKMDDVPKEKHPIAAFAWMYYDHDNNTLITAGLCDCMVFAKLDNGEIITNTPTADSAAEAERDRIWARETGTNRLNRSSGLVHDKLIAARRAKNDFANGVDAVLGPVPEAAEHIRIEKFDLGIAQIENVMVTTDGLMRLTDTFQIYPSDNVLLNAVLDSDLHYITNILREREHQNAFNAAIPIIKPHDDVGAAVFRFES